MLKAGRKVGYAERRANPLARFFNVLEGKAFAWVLLVPSLLLVALFIVYPLYRGIRLSFSELELLKGPDTKFIGLENFRTVLHDPDVANAARNTLKYTVVGLISQIALGMAAALLLSRETKFIWAARIAVMLPWFMPPVVTAYMWRFMLDAQYGIVTILVSHIGIDIGGQGIWANPDKALYGVLFVELWRSYPFFTLFILAGIQGIPAELRESTAIDGASAFQHFRYVMLPLLKPVLFVSTILEAIKLINSPTLVLLMTEGGPGDSTMVVPLLAFKKAYQAYDFGYASAISVAVLIAISGFAMVYIRSVGFGKEK
jgi:multiple sugar transport system permease protein